MYLADVFRTIHDGLSPVDKEALPAPLVPFKLGLAAEVLRNAELYAFDESALQMASHLKIGDPAELHRVLQSVLSGPSRTLFLEADGFERAEALTHLRNTVIRPLASNEGMPTRIGLLVEIQGNCEARFRPIWNHCSPTSALTKSARSVVRESRRLGNKRSALQERALLETLRLNANPGWTVINVAHEPDYPTIEKFADLVRTGDKTANSHFAGSQRQRLSGVFNRELSQDETLRIAWWSFCIQQMARFRLHCTDSDLHYIDTLVEIGVPKSSILKEACGNCDGELTNIAAMLSVLAAGAHASRDPVVVTEERPARDKLVKAPRQVKHIRRDYLQVVSLNVSDVEITKCARSVSTTRSPCEGTTKARHFVNGHLFRARNGLMTWRRPHWRGSEPPSPVLTRVR